MVAALTAEEGGPGIAQHAQGSGALSGRTRSKPSGPVADTPLDSSLLGYVYCLGLLRLLEQTGIY